MPEQNSDFSGNISSSTALKTAKLRQLFLASRAAVLSTLLLAALLSYIQTGLISKAVTVGWFLFYIASATYRGILVYTYFNTPNADDNYTYWLFRFRLSVLISGTIWGLASILLFPADDLEHQMFLVFILAGLTAGSVVAFSADLACAFLFCFSSLFPLTIRLLITGHELTIAMGIAALAFLGYMMISLHRIHSMLSENIQLRIKTSEREEVLRLSEERYRLLLNHSPVGIFHFDTDKIITFCNERFAEIIGKPIGRIVDSNINTFNEAVLLNASEQALRGRLYVNECEVGHRSSTKLWLDLTCSPSQDSTGNIIGGIAIVRDISERKQAEEMLRISAIAFESQSAMIVTAANSVILRANRAFTELTGYSAGEVIGKTPNILSSSRHDPAFFKAMWDSLKESGYWQGEIWNKRKNGSVDAEWLTISAVTAPDSSVTHYVGTYTDITENKDAMAEIHRLAYYDPLTHLPNRRLLQDRLSQGLNSAIHTGFYGAILFLDLDNFKTLNDTRGHDAGDQLLIEVSLRLAHIVRKSDVVGRLGGDEFVVLLENLGKDQEDAALSARQMGEKLLLKLADPYQIEGHTFHCTTSIGIRLYRDQETVEDLLRHADLAMYQAKTSGRNTLCFFDPTMQSKITARANLEKGLREALEGKQLQLHYQPQVMGEEIVGAEVLLRWHHHEQGAIAPSKFIPIAEKTGLILPIGQWVLETACQQLHAWGSYPQLKRLVLAVNVSAYQFRQADIVEQLQATIAKTGIKPNQLKLELTESVLLDNIHDTIRKMNDLRKIGIKFSLDDFGTGYSSFSYLTQLPLDELKIDRTFVSNIGIKPANAVIVQTIIGMAHNLGISVVAEGVETESQLTLLQEHGCPIFQGYFFSKPVPATEFERLIQSPLQIGV